MPAVSRNQAIAMAIAEHQPDKLFKRNQGMLKMKKSQMHDFAKTPRKGLPKKVGKKRVASALSAAMGKAKK